MKMIFAIIDRDDATVVVRNLSKRGFSCTKLPTSGGFLISNNITLMIGVDDKMVSTVIDIIKEFSHSRRQTIPSPADVSFGFDSTQPVEITVGGATIFVLNVEHFEKV